MTSELRNLINAAPDKLRQYIHDLETNCDPSGNVREIAALKENVAALSEMINILQKQVKP